MTVFIDADSCPVLVRDYVLEICAKNTIDVIFAANREILPKENQKYTMIVCSQEKDAADEYIFSKSNSASITETLCAEQKYGYNTSEKNYSVSELLQNGSDLVITRDLLLAKRLVEKNTACINDRGTEFSNANIDRLLKEREEDLQYVAMGLVKHAKGSGYNKKEFAAFANSFGKIISNFRVPDL